MDLFGEELKKIRIEKNYSMEQIARETKISKKFLEAIEENDFSIFPSETYLIGFLRTYAEYLGLESAKYINQYRNYKIQEQPIPINELLDIKKKIHPAMLVLLILLGVIVVAVSTIFVYSFILNKPGSEVADGQPQPQKADPGDGEIFYFKDEIQTAWFTGNDQIVIPLGEQEYTILIKEIGNPVKLFYANTEILLTREEELRLNLNDDENADLRIVYNALEERDNHLQVNLGLYKITAAITSTMSVNAERLTTTTPVTVESSQPAVVSTAALADTISTAADTGDGVVIFESEEAEAFIITIVFKGPCMFRYLADNKNRYQNFFVKDQKLDIEVGRSVKLWMSSAGSVKATISGKEVVFGKAGQVVSGFMQWRKDNNSDKYKLVMSPVD